MLSFFFFLMKGYQAGCTERIELKNRYISCNAVACCQNVVSMTSLRPHCAPSLRSCVDVDVDVDLCVLSSSEIVCRAVTMTCTKCTCAPSTFTIDL